MNKQSITERLTLLSEQRKQVLAKQEEGKNVVMSGQKIIDETNAMLHIVNGAEQDCQYWLQQIDEQEKKDALEKEAQANSVETVASFESADAYQTEETTPTPTEGE